VFVAATAGLRWLITDACCGSGGDGGTGLDYRKATGVADPVARTTNVAGERLNCRWKRSHTLI
jgi:hypothetical protein